MNFDSMLSYVRSPEYSRSFAQAAFPDGEIDQQELFSVKGSNFYIIPEFRWIELALTDQTPAIMPLIESCVPTLIHALNKILVIHAFSPKCVETCLNDVAEPLHIDVFTASRGTTFVQDLQIERGKIISDLGGNISQIHSIPDFENIVIYQNMLYFLGEKDQINHTFTVPTY